MHLLTEKEYCTVNGNIHYWINEPKASRYTLVFLPGLTADNRLFHKQIEYFANQYRLMVWDAPGHNHSRPFRLNHSLADKAKWLHEILIQEGIEYPILIGQSMGGYVAQCYMENFPHDIAGFISIDSAPLKRKYVTSAEIWMLKNCEWMYRLFPWKALKKATSYGCATTTYGKNLMKEMMSTYTHNEFCSLAGHGYRILAHAMEADLEYPITCPTLLLCGEKDRAAAAKRYNKHWASGENLPIIWLRNAGHNANTDVPEEVNRHIEEFIDKLTILYIHFTAANVAIEMR